MCVQTKTLLKEILQQRFAFVSDFNPCYKIAFEKQGVHPISVWWSIAGSNR